MPIDSSAEPQPPWILAVVADLFFTVQISDMAKRRGLAVRYVRTAPDALSQTAQQPKLVLIDLNLAGLDTPQLIRQCGIAWLKCASQSMG